MKTYKGERVQLLHLAAIIEDEARTYEEGWTVKGPDGQRTWDEKDSQWAHVRCERLRNGAALLRRIVARAAVAKDDAQKGQP